MAPLSASLSSHPTLTSLPSVPATAPLLWLLATTSLLSQALRRKSGAPHLPTCFLALLTILLCLTSLLPNLLPNLLPDAAPSQPQLLQHHRLLRQVPNVSPPPDSPPDPSPSPAPSDQAPITSPPATTIPATTSATITTTVAQQQTLPPSNNPSSLRSIPSRDECASGLVRMQAVLLLELCFEFLFLFLRCFADAQLIDSDSDPSVDVTMRGYIFVRAIYVVPVLVLNCAILWIGGGPNAACLSTYGETQVTFVHLIFYVLFCILIVIMGVYRIDSFEKNDTSTYDYPGPSINNQAHPDSGPPTRTTSYFRYNTNRRRSRNDSDYQLPTFRVNLGCCALNF